ncbi:coil containing protein [Vibrio phage 2.275.O._10N.286.54.E11]|nr:coil containing protein [Vibrio phage 2.275.O._10N.286.54.E11]
MENERESKFSEWAKLLVPVLLPMLIMGCIYLSNVVMSQGTQITKLKTHMDTRAILITKYEATFDQIGTDLQRIDLNISKLESRITVTEQSQGKIVSILDDLNKTLERINVTVGKLETRLDYTEKSGG